MSTHKIYSIWQRRREVPQIKLQGRWLENAGLGIGSALRVRVEHGRVIIEPADTAQIVAFPQIKPHLEAAA